MGILDDIKEAVVGKDEVTAEEVKPAKKAKKEEANVVAGVKTTGVKTTGVK